MCVSAAVKLLLCGKEGRAGGRGRTQAEERGGTCLSAASPQDGWKPMLLAAKVPS